MSSALLSPKLKYFNFTTETEKKKFIKFGETNERKNFGDLNTPIRLLFLIHRFLEKAL